MSKTSKIRRARKARDLALAEAKVAYGDAKYFQANEQAVVDRRREIESKWGYVLQILGETLPKEDLLRAVADTIPAARVSYESEWEAQWQVAAQRGLGFATAMSHQPMEAVVYTHALHQMITRYGEITRERPNLAMELQFNGQHSRYAMTLEAFMSMPKDYLTQKVASELVQHMRGKK